MGRRGRGECRLPGRAERAGAPSARLTRLRDWTEATRSPMNTLEACHVDGTAYFKKCLLCYGPSATILNKVSQIAARWFRAQPELRGQGDPPAAVSSPCLHHAEPPLAHVGPFLPRRAPEQAPGRSNLMGESLGPQTQPCGHLPTAQIQGRAPGQPRPEPVPAPSLSPSHRLLQPCPPGWPRGCSAPSRPGPARGHPSLHLPRAHITLLGHPPDGSEGSPKQSPCPLAQASVPRPLCRPRAGVRGPCSCGRSLPQTQTYLPPRPLNLPQKTGRCTSSKAPAGVSRTDTPNRPDLSPPPANDQLNFPAMLP